MSARWLGGMTFVALSLAIAAVGVAAAPAGKPVPGGYYQYWAGHGLTPGSSVTIEVGGQGTAAKVTWHLLPTAASGCATHDSSGAAPYDNQLVGGVRVAIAGDGSFHGMLRKADWAQVGKTKSYLAEVVGKFGGDGKAATGKLRLKYAADATRYTITCDGRWVSFKVRLNPDSV